ncbi:hypothetical protein HZA97_05285 [Candidatus Woesearchaeota archaeon]|nr:hypothetical protein [Candidatus Woesearchaeota archaeon]
MTNQNLTIIGTVHLDLDGQERLENLLERVRPSIVAVEISEKRVNRFRKSKRNYKKEAQEQMDFIRSLNLGFTEQHLAVLKELTEQDLKIQGFEYFAPEVYASKNPDVKIVCIDTLIQDVEKEELFKIIEQNFEKVMSVPKLRKKLLNQLELGTNYGIEKRRKDTTKWYQASGIASLSYDVLLKQNHHSFTAQERLNKLIYNPERDNDMEERIRQLHSQNPEGNIAAVVGEAHLYPLGRRLKDLDPTIMTLAEWDSTKTQVFRRLNEGIYYAIPKVKSGAEKVRRFLSYFRK